MTLCMGKTDNFRFKPEMSRRIEKLRSSFERAGPIPLGNMQRPNVMVLYIGKTGIFRITGHDRFLPEIVVSHLKEHLKLPPIPSFYQHSMSGFRETDNFRLYRLLSRDIGRNRKKARCYELGPPFYCSMQKTVLFYLKNPVRYLTPRKKIF